MSWAQLIEGYWTFVGKHFRGSLQHQRGKTWIADIFFSEPYGEIEVVYSDFESAKEDIESLEE